MNNLDFEAYKTEFEHEYAKIEHGRVEIALVSPYGKYGKVTAKTDNWEIAEPIKTYAGKWPWSKRPSAKRLAQSCNELLNLLCLDEPSTVAHWLKLECEYYPKNPTLLKYSGMLYDPTSKIVIRIPWELRIFRAQYIDPRSERFWSHVDVPDDQWHGGHVIRIRGRFAAIPMEYEIVEPEPKYLYTPIAE
ncbi:MAG: hypothetical protein WC455_11845 [Dehalococcoidia bacterium]|jgi:hypothetical protein